MKVELLDVHGAYGCLSWFLRVISNCIVTCVYNDENY